MRETGFAPLVRIVQEVLEAEMDETVGAEKGERTGSVRDIGVGTTGERW